MKNDVLLTVVDGGLNSLPTEGYGRSYMYSSRAGPVAAVGVCGSEDRAAHQLMRCVGWGAGRYTVQTSPIASATHTLCHLYSYLVSINPSHVQITSWLSLISTP